MKYLFHPLAEKELLSTIDFYEKQQPELGK